MKFKDIYVNCTDVFWARDKGQDSIGYGFQGKIILLIYVLKIVSFLTGSEGWRCAVYMPSANNIFSKKNPNFMMVI